MAAEKLSWYYVTAEYTDKDGSKRFDEFIVKSYCEYSRAQYWIKERLYPNPPSNFIDLRIIALDLMPQFKITHRGVESIVFK